MSVDSPARPRFKAGFRLGVFAYLLVAPVLILILALVGYPFFYAIYISFTDAVVGNPGHWIGFGNFAYLAQNPSFISSIINTVILVLVSDGLKLLIGLGLALLVNRQFRARGLVRSFLMLPWAMPGFVAFLAWRLLYLPIGGGLSLALQALGLNFGIIDWLGQRPTALPSVIVATVWRGFPFWFISILAGLQAIPAELYEAARVDGANRWQQFWAVTFPGIRTVVIVTALLSSIWTANSFENVWLLTQGGPSDATMVFPVLAYFGMQTQRIGEAAAVSVATLPVLIVLVLLATTLMHRDED
ncbi:MAG: carbohydrate ABC transporter permease [Devosia sp.]|jgi:ABC-type sugar transport system permease subunit